jgi:hypothetical protein
MKKVITFSLWGDNPTYCVGAIRNAKDAKTIYPGFECWFYVHSETVPENIVEELKSLDNTKVILKSGDLANENCKPRMWRFEAIDDNDVEIMMSRDTDTRITPREQFAVNEWMVSNKMFHIMRDHPHHNFCILGGMFGTRKIPQIPKWGSIMEVYKKTSDRMYDQDFLRDYVYPLIRNNSVIHATFHKTEPHATNFPINYCCDYRFVGEYVYADDSRSEFHINELKRSVVSAQASNPHTRCILQE